MYFIGVMKPFTLIILGHLQLFKYYNFMNSV